MGLSRSLLGKNKQRSQRQWSSFDLLPALVREWVSEHKRFDIQSIPPLECASTLAAIQEDGSSLGRIQAVVEGTDELRPWRDLVTSAYDDFEAVTKIRTRLMAEPGTVQSKLGKAISVDGRRVSRIGEAHDRCQAVAA